VDGLRLDATHALADTSERHLIAEIADAVHARGGFVTAEDERNPAQLLRDPTGRGAGLDAAWADDFHHQARVALTGTNERHYASYSGTAAALADVLRHGWTYRGQPFPAWDNRPRGEPCRHLPAKAFIFCIENHDQIGNRARGGTPGAFGHARAISRRLGAAPPQSLCPAAFHGAGMGRQLPVSLLHRS